MLSRPRTNCIACNGTRYAETQRQSKGYYRWLIQCFRCMQVVQLAVVQDHNQDQVRVVLHQDRVRSEYPASNAKLWAR
jgi:hypothetical protein